MSWLSLTTHRYICTYMHMCGCRLAPSASFAIMAVLCDLLHPGKMDATRGYWQFSKQLERYAFSTIDHNQCDIRYLDIASHLLISLLCTCYGLKYLCSNVTGSINLTGSINWTGKMYILRFLCCIYYFISFIYSCMQVERCISSRHQFWWTSQFYCNKWLFNFYM